MTKQPTPPSVEAGTVDSSAAVGRPQELLPCPFCSDGGDVWQPAPMETVRCSQCGAEGPRGKTDDEMAELWNTRADSSQQTIKELREALRSIYNCGGSHCPQCRKIARAALNKE